MDFVPPKKISLFFKKENYLLFFKKNFFLSFFFKKKKKLFFFFFFFFFLKKKRPWQHALVLEKNGFDEGPVILDLFIAWQKFVLNILYLVVKSKYCYTWI